MKLSVKDIYDLQEGLSKLSQKNVEVGIGFKIARISRLVGEEFKTANESRSKIIKKYKDKDLEDGRIKLKEDKLEDYQKEISELMRQEVNIDVQKISIDELKDISIAPKALEQIHLILEEAE